MATSTLKTSTISNANIKYNSALGNNPPTVIPFVTQITQGAADRQDSLSGMDFDSDNNIYGGGAIDLGSGYNNSLICKLAPGGTLLQSRYLNTSSGYGNTFSDCFVDQAGNIYFTGIRADSSGSGGQYGTVTKYNPSLTYQWQKQGRLVSTQSTVYSSITFDNTEMPIFSGYANDSSGVAQSIIAKYNVSGDEVWSSRYAITNLTNQLNSSCWDNDGNVFSCGLFVQGTTQYGFLGVHNGTTGAKSKLFWIYKSSPGSQELRSVASNLASSSNKIFCGGHYNNGTTDQALIMNVSASGGSIAWARSLYESTSTISRFVSIASDSSGNVYAYGTTGSGSSQKLLIAKYNSSGTLQWQRTIARSGGSISASKIKLNPTNGIYLIAQLNPSGGQPDIIMFNLPTDGSKTGTYTLNGITYTYATSTLTNTSESISISDLTSTYSPTSFGSNDSSTVTTDTTVNLTQYISQIV